MYSLIIDMELGFVNSVILEHHLKALLPIKVIKRGIFISTNDEHPLKDSLPIDVTEKIFFSMMNNNKMYYHQYWL